MLGILPRRYWSRLDPPFPMVPAAFASGIVTLAIGFALGVPGFFVFASALAGANNSWMIQTVTGARGASAQGSAAGLVPYAISPFSLPLFLFFTPLGLLSTYIVASGSVRAAAAWFDDPRGDFFVSAADWAIATGLRTNRQARSRQSRERREGDERPDILKTGEWAGIDADYVLLSSRRKPEWEKGAIVMSSEDWYRLGAPYDMETPSGLRTAYPLTKLETVEVVRRGIMYELPALTRGARGAVTSR